MNAVNHVTRSRGSIRATVGLAATAAVLSLSVAACGGSSSKSYDISPIFPLSANKCDKYHGKAEGSGFNATCHVSKADCEQAVSDWRQGPGRIAGAINFRCD